MTSVSGKRRPSLPAADCRLSYSAAAGSLALNCMIENRRNWPETDNWRRVWSMPSGTRIGLAATPLRPSAPSRPTTRQEWEPLQRLLMLLVVPQVPTLKPLGALAAASLSRS